MNIITPEELAEMLKLPRRTVMESITRQKGFPPSITGRRVPRWDANAVQQFFNSKTSENCHKTSAQ